MIPRYAHPDVAWLWSDLGTYRAWLQIEQETALVQRRMEMIPAEAATAIGSPLLAIGPVELKEIAALEKETKHDVAAFVAWLRGRVSTGGSYVHLGLTSSDLVDTAQGMRFRAMSDVLLRPQQALASALTSWETDETWVLGRTHGQPAEPMHMRVRVAHWAQLIFTTTIRLMRATRHMHVGKLTGPLGTYAHNPPQIEQAVCRALRLQAQGHGSSQIVPRAQLAAWANSAAAVVQACAKIAMDLRLMNLLGEASVGFTPGQVGSSSMAHKRNPIRAEQITGLARIAQGYATMLQPLDLWLERDISHSSVERIAVPDLWHVTMRAIEQTTLLLTETEVDEYAAMRAIDDAGAAPWVAHLTNIGITERGLSAEDAREWAQRNPLGTTTPRLDWFMRNYPWQPVAGSMDDHERE